MTLHMNNAVAKKRSIALDISREVRWAVASEGTDLVAVDLNRSCRRYVGDDGRTTNCPEWMVHSHGAFSINNLWMCRSAGWHSWRSLDIADINHDETCCFDSRNHVGTNMVKGPEQMRYDNMEHACINQGTDKKEGITHAKWKQDTGKQQCLCPSWKFPMPETPGLMLQKHDDTALALRTFHNGKRGISIRHQLSRGNIDYSSWISQDGFRGSLGLERNYIERWTICDRGCTETLCGTIHFVWQIWTWLKLQPKEFSPVNCDILCVRCMSTWFRQVAEVHTMPPEQEMRPQILDWRAKRRV